MHFKSFLFQMDGHRLCYATHGLTQHVHNPQAHIHDHPPQTSPLSSFQRPAAPDLLPNMPYDAQVPFFCTHSHPRPFRPAFSIQALTPASRRPSPLHTPFPSLIYATPTTALLPHVHHRRPVVAQGSLHVSLPHRHPFSHQKNTDTHTHTHT